MQLFTGCIFLYTTATIACLFVQFSISAVASAVAAATGNLLQLCICYLKLVAEAACSLLVLATGHCCL